MAYDKGNYSTDKKMYDKNTMNHDPNAGENVMHYEGNAEMKRDMMIADKAGVEDGLGMLMPCEVKNAEMVTMNQRPMANSMDVSDMAGKFKIGTS